MCSCCLFSPNPIISNAFIQSFEQKRWNHTENSNKNDTIITVIYIPQNWPTDRIDWLSAISKSARGRDVGLQLTTCSIWNMHGSTQRAVTTIYILIFIYCTYALTVWQSRVDWSPAQLGSFQNLKTVPMKWLFTDELHFAFDINSCVARPMAYGRCQTA